ncbi:hypothetical protein ONZ45_g804 [Pleurotus djamor]|nr:hypothetical protein ONZ45_g804 [Pleurotus djamor]
MNTAFPRQTGKLFDLSSEVFAIITSFLDTPDFLHLCFTSRQMHWFLLPLFLSRHGVTQSENPSTVDHLTTRIATTQTVAPFQAVWRSPSIKTVKKLSCCFHFPETQLLWEIRAIYRILQSTERLEAVCLDFSSLPFGLKEYPYQQTMKTMQEWRLAFAILIRAIIDKAPSSIELYEQVHFTPESIQLPPLGSFRGSAQRLWYRIVGRKQRYPDILQPIFHSPGLTTLSHLIIEHAHFTLEQWKRIARLRLPSLKSLCTRVLSSAYFRCLCEFLSHNPSITNLEIPDATIDPVSRKYPIARHFLPALEALDAPWTVYIVFLRLRPETKSQAKPIPITAFPKLFTYRIAVPAFSVSAQWDGPSLLPDLPTTGGPARIWIGCSSRWLRQAPDSFRNQCTTEIELVYTYVDEQDAKKLVDWLASFVGLRKVCVYCLDGVPQFPAEEFAQSVFKRCTAVEKVVFDGEAFTSSLCRVLS